MPKVRTVFQPDTLQEVGEQEAAQLAAEGLLVDPKEWDRPAPTVPTVAPSTVTAPTPAVPAPPIAAKEVGTDGGK